MCTNLIGAALCIPHCSKTSPSIGMTTDPFWLVKGLAFQLALLLYGFFRTIYDRKRMNKDSANHIWQKVVSL